MNKRIKIDMLFESSNAYWNYKKLHPEYIQKFWEENSKPKNHWWEIWKECHIVGPIRIEIINKKNKLISSSKSIKGIVLECVKCGNNSHTDYPYRSYHIICDSCHDNLWRHKYGSREMPELISSFIRTGTHRPNHKGRRNE